MVKTINESKKSVNAFRSVTKAKEGSRGYSDIIYTTTIRTTRGRPTIKTAKWVRHQIQGPAIEPGLQ